MSDKMEKKRKRQSNGVGTPNKKLATSDTIKVIHAEDDGLHPVLLSTSGVNAPKVPFQAYSRPRKNNKKAASGSGPIKPATHDLLLQSSQHPRLDYTAVPSPIDDQLSHYVAIYDPAKKTLQIAPAHHLHLRSTLRAEAKESEQKGKTFGQQREALGQEFGTKKAKKAIASKSTNAITGDDGKHTDVQSAILESVGETTAGLASKLSQQEQNDAALAAKPIPWPHLDAENAEAVYTFDTLLPPNDARLVKTKDWKDNADDDTKIGFKHQYPVSRFAFVAKSDADDAPLRLKALKYLTLLLEFRDVLTGGGRGPKKVPKKEMLQKKLPPSRWPSELVDSVRRRFSNDTGAELGKWQLDNLATHICALALYVDHWICDVWHLKDDLKLDLKELSHYFMELGARVKKPTESERNRMGMNKAQAQATRIARLMIPLEFPKVRNVRRA
ncbi:Putative RNA polymerase I associated factor, A49 [Septoria linicola]|uniref:RNA polymerase I associated factor, A49 n=1 Tax=Septoria linicola TaxID=215465 RepID=A0A9Q9AQ85_9PEZI|nr:putative RNA polymerase I associated factor, A49 [Septoria linicola]USW51113.1 Putative RNA polymerase I associated factor, A49 [Septoria linicola]